MIMASTVRKKKKGAVRRPVRKRKKPVRKVRIGIWTALCVSVLILSGVFAFHKHTGSSYTETGAKVPKGCWRYGIDISHQNKPGIVWDSLYVMTDSKGRTVRDPFKAKDIKPVSFVFIKATEGAGFKDEDFQKNWKAAGQSSLRRGAYHFFRSSKDGEAQARNFISAVGDLRTGDLPPVLDIETIHRGCSKKQLNDRALQWLEIVCERYGKKPIVYASDSFLRDYLSKEITDNYPLWIAHYGKAKPDREDWTWWQVSDKAVVKGIPGLVDVSVMREE